MRTCSTSISKTLLVSLLLAGGLIFATESRSDPQVPISECRQQSVDQSGFVECLSLLLQQSDASLIALQENWRVTLLAESQDTERKLLQADTTLLDDELPAGESFPGGVIAIVDGETLGETVSRNTIIVNVDDEASAAKSTTEVPQRADPRLNMQRFEAMADLYRQYRNQRCEWEAGIRVSVDAAPYYQACVIALNRLETKRLRRLLVEKRASDIAGDSYRGYYVRTASGGSFQSCDRRQDWWVTGTDEVLQSLERRYDDITSENLELVYVELRGNPAEAVTGGAGADFIASFSVGAVNLMRPVLEQDCSAGEKAETQAVIIEPQLDEGERSTVNEDDSATLAVLSDTIDVVTVDDLGDAGFLYGYFSNWMSACAIDQLAVCKAQTQANYSTEDAWVLSADRSSAGDWRLWLIPTTDNHNVGQLLQLSIDDSEVGIVRVTDTSVEVNRGMAVATGVRARELIGQMRSGQSFDFSWIKTDTGGAKISFSLQGITRALKYFDQPDK